MESQKHYAMIGAFIILTGASFIGVTLWLAFGDFTKGFRTYLAYMEESVSGLYVDAPVKYQGVEVGRVTALDLDADNPQRVRIVELSGGASDAARLERGEGEEFPVLKTGPSLFTRFDTVITELIANVSRVAGDTHKLMSPDNLENTEKILLNVETLTGQSVEDMSRMMASGAQASAQLPGLIAGLNRSAASVQAVAEDIVGTSQAVRLGVQATGPVTGDQAVGRQPSPRQPTDGGGSAADALWPDA
jgi:phospholipid/cholesterol/gamma-HCH transport system substrate-binding protein